MSQHEGYRRISQRDAFSIIGLHDKNESTFHLENMIIEIENGGLKFTHLSSSKSASPDQTIYTSDPFKYTHSGVDYLIVNENGELSIFEEEQIIGG